MAGIPPIKIRGIRQSIPSGYVIGRTRPGNGDAELIPYHVLGAQLVGSGTVAPGVAVAPIPPAPPGGSGSTVTKNSANKALALAGIAATLDLGAPEEPWWPPGKKTSAATSTVGVLGCTVNGLGSTPGTGILGDLYVPFACTIVSATLLADVAGNAVFDIWKTTYAGGPPTISNTICAAALPTLSGAISSQDSTLTGWTKTVAAGDWIRFVLNSAFTLTRVTLELKTTK